MNVRMLNLHLSECVRVSVRAWCCVCVCVCVWLAPRCESVLVCVRARARACCSTLLACFQHCKKILYYGTVSILWVVVVVICWCVSVSVCVLMLRVMFKPCHFHPTGTFETQLRPLYKPSLLPRANWPSPRAQKDHQLPGVVITVPVQVPALRTSVAAA